MSEDDSPNQPRFATTEHVEPLEDLVDHIIERVFGLSAAFVSDESDLYSFLHDPVRDAFLGRTPEDDDIRTIEAAHQLIEDIFGVDVRPEVRLWRIAEQIVFHGRSRP
jgi:hypothetical protein